MKTVDREIYEKIVNGIIIDEYDDYTIAARASMKYMADNIFEMFTICEKIKENVK